MQPDAHAPVRRVLHSVDSLVGDIRISRRFPWFVLREQVGATRVEQVRVSPAVYATLRQEVRSWAKRHGLRQDPDAHPHGACNPALPRLAVEVVQ